MGICAVWMAVGKLAAQSPTPAPISGKGPSFSEAFSILHKEDQDKKVVSGAIQVNWSDRQGWTNPPGDHEKQVLQSCVPSRLYGMCGPDAKTLELTISLDGPNSGKWELWINGEQYAAQKTYPLTLIGERWYWEGSIILVPAQASGTSPADKSIDAPLLHCTLQNADADKEIRAEVRLVPAEVWVLAGDSGVAAGLDPEQIRKRFVFADPPLFPFVEENGPANAFAAALREQYATAHSYAPAVLLIIQPFPDTLLNDIIKHGQIPKQPLPLAPPSTTPPTVETAPKSPRDEAPSFACRGLIWWHGEYEAEMADDAREGRLATALNPPAPSWESKEEGLRSRYARQLARHVLRKWWHTTAWKPDEKKVGYWKTDDQYQGLLRVVVVQLPAARNSSPDQPAFVQYWRGLDSKNAGFAAPVSTWSAIRYAQFDVIRQLQAIANGINPPFFFLRGTSSKKNHAVPAAALCALPVVGGSKERAVALAAAAFDKPARLAASLDLTAKTLRLPSLQRPAKGDRVAVPLQYVKRGGEIIEIKDDAIKSDPNSDLLITLPEVASSGSLRTPPADAPAPAMQMRLDKPVEQVGPDKPVEFDIPLPP